MPLRFDPQLDTNFLIRVMNGETAFVAYAQTHQAVGLSYYLATCAEFLAQGTQADLQLLGVRYGIKLSQDVTTQVIDATAARLQLAFHGDPLGRVLHHGDARVAASAYLKKETLATGDLRFYKRSRDLGLNVDFVGTGPSAAKAAAYSPRPVTIP